MTSRSGRLAAAALALAAGLTILPAAPGGGAPVPSPTQEELPALGLVRQTSTVPARGLFEAWLDGADLPADGSVELELHGRVRSRSELALSHEGRGLRTTVYRIERPVSELPPGEQGARRIAVSLDPSAPNGISLTTAGVYPVEIVAKDAGGTPVASLVSHLLLEPTRADESPPLAVAVVAEVDPPADLRPDGTVEVDDTELDELVAWVGTVAADRPGLNLAVDPAGLAALTLHDSAAAADAVAALRALAASSTTVPLPYAPASAEVLVDAGLAAELAEHMERGRAVTAAALGVEPTGTTWTAGPDLGLDGLAAVVSLGFQHVVLEPGQVEPLRSGLLSYSLAQPFVIGDDDREPPIDALALDRGVLGHLDSDATPGTEASRVLAELAMMWFERPGVPRSVVLPLDPETRAAVVAQVVGALDGAGIFASVSLDEAFAAAAPLEQPGGGRVDRELTPEDPDRLDADLVRRIPAARSALSSFASLVGPDDPRLETANAHLLLATSSAVSARDQAAHVDAARHDLDSVTGLITAPDRETVTLTAREGTVPLTLHNDGDQPVHAIVHLRSPKLEFPDGASLPVVLEPGSTRMDIAVRTLASGSFPLVVEVTSPDGLLSLASVEYSIQSTAVAGLGIILSAGAALFLMVWWARHWSRTRRSAKLVEAKHLAGHHAAHD